MGFDIHGVRFLLAARASGVSFRRSATIGRQGLHITPEDLGGVLRQFGQPLDAAQVRQLYAADGYAEPLLRLLGAEEVCSLDASAYEDATRVQDMNQPLPADLQAGFTAVIDSGSLEHIFDFPQALRNCMQMAQVGGHLLLLTPANNFMGHGFYQFSPEVFFRALSADNGYALERILIYESFHDAPWYQVAAPEKVGRRVELLNSFHTHLLVQARRSAEHAIFAAPPQQSDYVTEWGRHAPGTGASSGATLLHLGRAARLKRRLPYRLARLYFAFRSVFKDPLHNREFFEPVSLERLVAGRL